MFSRMLLTLSVFILFFVFGAHWVWSLKPESNTALSDFNATSEKIIMVVFLQTRFTILVRIGISTCFAVDQLRFITCHTKKCGASIAGKACFIRADTTARKAFWSLFRKMSFAVIHLKSRY